MIENECDSALNDEGRAYSPPLDEKPNIQDIYIFDPDGRRNQDDELKVFNIEIQKAKQRWLNKHSRSVVDSVYRKEAGSDLIPLINEVVTITNPPILDPAAKLNPNRII